MDSQIKTAIYTIPLSEKIDKAILFLRENEKFALESDPEMGYFLAFSGGKDSVVIKELARMAGVKFKSFYNQTTVDPPELMRFIQEKHPDVSWNKPEMNMVYMMAHKAKGPPTRLNRWCCQIYKEQGGTGKCKILGIRAEESARRANTWKQTITNRNGGHIFCPILYWSEQDIWNFIRKNNIPYCSLYDEGIRRIGCVGCPMGNRARDFARWPKFENLWKLGIQRYYDRFKGVPRKDGKPRWVEKFRNWVEVWDWWMELPKKNANECQLEFAWT